MPTFKRRISPCPNDTFIFEAIKSNLIDTGAYTFEFVMEDVEALNLMAMRGELDITKLSYHAFAHVQDQYTLLQSGSALGRDCGPLLIAKKAMTQEDLLEATIAIPGMYTTAHFLLNFAYPYTQNKCIMLFSDIENAVLSNEVDAGVIIHENRFTYKDKGLTLITDLGAHWENVTSLPIPLGGIAMKSEHGLDHIRNIENLIRKSVQYARKHNRYNSSFITENAQEMSPEVCRQHIDLYVNQYSENLGKEGQAAVELLLYTINAQRISLSTNPSV